MVPEYIPVSYVGKTAHDWLAHGMTGEIRGVTSRGLFLNLVGERVVFISFEPFRGPLTINLANYPEWMAGIRLGEPASLTDGILSFKGCDLRLDLRIATIWKAAPTSKELLPVDKCIEHLKATAVWVLSKQPRTGLSQLLVVLLGLPAKEQVGQDTGRWTGALSSLNQSLKSDDLLAALDAANQFLGMGPGLTPSGDDLLLGLLLTFRRWGGRLALQFDLQRFIQELLGEARRKTTKLSACLLECAANGQADERLIAGLDGLLAGQLSSQECAAHLTAWGSSSGSDAFVGMALAILVLSPVQLRSLYAC